MKWILILLSLLAVFACIKILRARAREINDAEGVPENIVGHLDQPRSVLIKTIARLQAENEELKAELKEKKKKV